jgi:uncharacterized membrane protein
VLSLLEEHAAHIGPVLIVFAAILCLWLHDLRTQPEHDEVARRREWNTEVKEHRLQTRPTRRVARHAVALLIAVFLLLATSLVLYATETLGEPQLLLVIWAHVVLGVAICAMTAIKLRAVGCRKIRRTMRFESLSRVTSSATLTALLVPLLVTGVILVFAPSTSGFAARLHLLVAAWFSLLVIMHTYSLVRGVIARLGIRPNPSRIPRVAAGALPLAATASGDPQCPHTTSARGRTQTAPTAPSITKEGSA